jgi:hypothetical protein
MLVYRSDFDVSRSVPTSFCRVWVLVLSGALCLLGGLKPVCAAGCHVPDLPVLQSRFSWERDQGLDRNASLVVPAPPILTHPPCQGEAPHSPASSSVTGPAMLLACTHFDPLGVSGCLAILPHHLHCQPVVICLNRPPRPIELGVKIEWPA